MKSILIQPSKLEGTINAPPSKSLSHRAIICASLCNEKESIIDNVILSEDIHATIDGMIRLGADIELKKSSKNYSVIIKNQHRTIKNPEINCGESGSTLRFLIPLALTLTDECIFSGRGKLVERPLDVYYKIFEEQNIKYNNKNGNLPLNIKGNLSAGIYNIPGSISSQFITGLFFALPLLKENSIINITDKLESRGYVDLTLDMLSKFNINIENDNYTKFIIKPSEYKASDYTVEGDFSQGAFFLAAHEIGNNVTCTGLSRTSLQGDKEIVNIISRYKNLNSNHIVIDASQIPDLVPIITVLASLKAGIKTEIINAQRLRIKESDRLTAISTEMNKLGACVTETKDGLIIEGQQSLKGDACVDSWNDHRIAMSLAIAATKCENDITLKNYTAVNKSYPEFWNDYKALGGKIDELNLG